MLVSSDRISPKGSPWLAMSQPFGLGGAESRGDSTMTHRLLPVSDWIRLDGTSLRHEWRKLSPQKTNVLVVEDDRGDIVGCWAFIYVLHAEGVWVAPEHRGRSVVARHLLRGMRNYADVAGERAVWTGANDPAIARILNGMGASLVPFDSYTIPLVKGES